MSRCDETCKDCKYLGLMPGGVKDDGSISGTMMHCNYITITEHRRPCPAGTGCTVKVKGRRIRINPRPATASANKRRVKGTELLQGRQRLALDRIMAEQGLSLPKLAKRLGLSYEAVRQWYREYAWARWETIEKAGMQRPEECPTREELMGGEHG